MPTVKGSLADSLGGEVGEKEKEGFVLAEHEATFFT